MLRDEEGREVAFAGSHGFQQDPVMHYEIPRDGRYVVEIADSIFRGREDFVYRLSLGPLPLISSVFPSGRPGRRENHGRDQRLESPLPPLYAGCPGQVARALIRWTCPQPPLLGRPSFALDALPECAAEVPTTGPNMPSTSRCR